MPIRNRVRICLVIAAALSALLTGRASAAAANLSFQCVNSTSGAAWTVMVDEQHGTVDGAPAVIGPGRITWRDRGGGSYDLDRKSGALTFTNSSSMGGYMLFHRCHLK
jgi:hypothetical protein